MITAHDVAIAIIGFEHPGARVIVTLPPEDKVTLAKNMVATYSRKPARKSSRFCLCTIKRWTICERTPNSRSTMAKSSNQLMTCSVAGGQ